MSFIWHRSIIVSRSGFASVASAPLRIPHHHTVLSKRTALIRTFSAPRGAEAVRFSYVPDDARRKFEQWVQTNVPVLSVPRISSVKAIYLPFWSFKAAARIQPLVGGSFTEEVSGPELQIYAGHVYPRALVEVCKTHPSWARPFEPSMLDLGQGWMVEHVQPYETYESTAWAIVKETALAQLKRQHTLAASITFSSVESRRILMPVYEITYKWWGEDLRCFVNGSTGASYGVQQEIGGPMLAKAMGMLRSLAGPSSGQGSMDPQKVGALVDFLRRLSIDPRAIGPLVTLFGGVLRPFAKLLFWPPFLVGSLLAFGGFTLSQAMLPIAKQRKSFAEWEEQRAAEKRMQAGLSDDWNYKAKGSSYSEASSSTGSSWSSRSSSGNSYRSSRGTTGSASSASQGSSSPSQRQQQQQEKAQPKGKRPPYVDENDYYAILAVPRSASVKQIQESFRLELLKYHPDHAQAAGWEMAAASDRTRMIIKAYGTLRDPTKRAMYDSTYRSR